MSSSRSDRLYLILAIVGVGAILRFYGLNWGDGLFFHPDEGNMARAITQLSLKNNLNPDFYAYGQLPLYLAYGSFQLISWLKGIWNLEFGIWKLYDVPFSDAIYILRFWSALFSTLTISLVYLISRKLLPHLYSLIAITLVAFMPGLIQSAHFGTTESILTFLFMLIFYLSLKRASFLLLAGVFFGLAVGTKASAFYFITPVAISSLYFVQSRKKFIYFWILFGLISLIFVFLSSPYNLIDYKSYLSTIHYESAVALGNIKVFYTRQFENSVPLIFQFGRVFPFAVGFMTTAIGLLGGLIAIKERKFTSLVLFLSFVTALAVNGFMFAKWTRFMVPVFPLFAIFTACALYKLKNKIAIVLVLFFAVLQGLLFFQIYTRPDTRVAVSAWTNENIPDESYILSETANVVDIPIRAVNNYEVISFDFYNLDQETELFEALVRHLEKADYIFVPSRRLFANLPQNKGSYLLLEKYYDALFSGRLGFELVHTQQPYSNAPGWSKIEEAWAEETFTVFDHPTIRVYKKVKSLKPLSIDMLE